MHSRKIIVIPEEENENNDDILETIRRASVRISNLSISNLKEKRRNSKLQKRNKSANFSDNSHDLKNSFEKLEFLFEDWSSNNNCRTQPSFLSQSRTRRNFQVNSQSQRCDLRVQQRSHKSKDEQHLRTKSEKENVEREEVPHRRQITLETYRNSSPNQLLLQRKCLTPREKSENPREFFIPQKYLKTEDSSDERTIEIEPPFYKTPKKGRELHTHSPISISTPSGARPDTRTSSSTTTTEKNFVFDQATINTKANNAKFYNYKRLFPEEMPFRIDSLPQPIKVEKNSNLKMANKDLCVNNERKEVERALNKDHGRSLGKVDHSCQKEKKKRHTQQEEIARNLVSTVTAKYTTTNFSQAKKNTPSGFVHPHQNLHITASEKEVKPQISTQTFKLAKENIARPPSSKTPVVQKTLKVGCSQLNTKPNKTRAVMERENIENHEADLKKKPLKIVKNRTEEVYSGKTNGIAAIEKLLAGNKESHTFLPQGMAKDPIKRSLEKEIPNNINLQQRSKTKQKCSNSAGFHESPGPHTKQRLLSDLLKLKDETRKVLYENETLSSVKLKQKSNPFDRLYNEIIIKIKEQAKS